MNIVEKLSKGLLRTYEITVPAQELDEKLSAKITEIRPEVRLKGFRPGKVPASHIRKVFGASIMGEILQKVVPEATNKTFVEKKVRPASQPSIDLKSDADEVVKKGADFNFEISLEIMPDFDLTNPKNFRLTRPVASVGDHQIQDSLNELAEQSKTYKLKEQSESAVEGDKLVINFSGKVAGETFEGGSAEGSELVLGSGQFIPGFEDQLIGTKTGDQVEVRVTFPENYQNKNLAGKDAVFDTKVCEVQAAQEALLDDALAERLGMPSLNALKNAVKTRLEQEHTQASRAKVKRVLLDQLDEAHQGVALPDKMVEQEFNQIWTEVKSAIEKDELDDDDKNKTEDQLKAEYKAISQRRVRLGLILAEMGKEGNIEVTQEELARAVNQEAARYPGQEAKVAEFYKKNQGALQALQAPIYEEKVVDYILELAHVEDIEVQRDILFSDDELPVSVSVNGS